MVFKKKKKGSTKGTRTSRAINASKKENKGEGSSSAQAINDEEP